MSRLHSTEWLPPRRIDQLRIEDYENHPVFGTRTKWRQDTHRIIFGNLTPAGRIFDVLLIFAILASVIVVMAESVETIREVYGPALVDLEWMFTAVFTVEYVLRILSAERAGKYARSFFGIVDLMALLPGYLSLLVPGGQALTVIRMLRVLRVFRVLKLWQFVGGEQVLIRALRNSAYKIAVFLVAVLALVTVVGSIMYVLEGQRPGSAFHSIPAGVYWAIVTVTTVGFGDITPQTPPGQFLAALLMILGYGVIAVPTGIVTAQMAGNRARATVPDSTVKKRVDTCKCVSCGMSSHDWDARHCKRCGEDLSASRRKGV